MVLYKLNSTNLKYCSFDYNDDQKLTCAFDDFSLGSGKDYINVYEYKMTSIRTFLNLIAAESHGVYFNKEIKPTYQFVKNKVEYHNQQIITVDETIKNIAKDMLNKTEEEIHEELFGKKENDLFKV